MLIKNDFLNHWKTKLLCKRLGDGPALRALLSLWSYCEQRRAWQFDLTTLELAGVCDFGGDHVQLYHDLEELRFILPVENGGFEVNGWGEQNKALVSKWPGRHLVKGEFYHPLGHIAKATDQPIAPPIDSANGEPIARAIGLDRIGEDRIGLEGITRTHARGAPVSVEEAKAYAVTWANSCGEMITPDPVVVSAWFDHRAAVGWIIVRNGNEIPIADWKADLQQWLRAENQRNPSRPDRSGSQNAILAQKKEAAAAEPAWDWRRLAQQVLDWSPVGTWEEQTGRSRTEIRRAYASLSPEKRAAFDPEKGGAAA